MEYQVTFTNSRKPEIFDDVKTFVLLGQTTLIKYTDGSTEELTNVLGISAYFYNEG